MLFHQVSFGCTQLLEGKLILQIWSLLFKLFEASVLAGRHWEVSAVSGSLTQIHLPPFHSTLRYATGSTDKQKGQPWLEQQEHLWLYMKVLIHIVINIFVTQEQRKQTLATKDEILF